jgi:hypothetical protein
MATLNSETLTTVTAVHAEAAVMCHSEMLTMVITQSAEGT